MKKYTKIVNNNEIVFKNLLDDSKLKIIHYDDEFIFDTIFISEKYDLNFIEYIIEQLKISKDIGVIFVEYDSPLIETILSKNSMKILNYQYTIKKSNDFKVNTYEVSNGLNQEEKNFYLKFINKLAQDNLIYLNSNKHFQKYDEKWFDNEEIEYRVYRKKGKIIGIVDYKNFDKDSSYGQVLNNHFNYNNKLCIRCLLSEDEQIMEDILKDLLNFYKKDIIINITYNEKKLKNVVKNLNSEFNFCQYILIENDNN